MKLRALAWFGTLALAALAMACESSTSTPAPSTDTAKSDQGGGSETVGDDTGSGGDQGAGTDQAAGTDSTGAQDQAAPTDKGGGTDTAAGADKGAGDAIPQGEPLLCIEVVNCIGTECASAKTQAEQAACIEAKCESKTNAAEFDLAWGFMVCASQKCGKNGKVDTACLPLECLDEATDCFSGAAYGDNLCVDLSTCLGGCKGQMQCSRECYASATQESVGMEVAVEFCAQEYCGTKTGTALQNCFKTELGPGGHCEGQALACDTQGNPPAEAAPEVSPEAAPEAGPDATGGDAAAAEAMGAETQAE